MKKILKKLLPEKFILLYHWLLSLAAAFFYRYPSSKMIVIGVTGTKGKTSTANFIWSVLMAGGFKTGLISTANIRLSEREFLNPYHMTMPGRFIIQRLMRQMKGEGCQYCIVETTSEGLKQYRHVGISYDIAVFTNLTPEHLPSHSGSFEKYKEAKARLFEVARRQRKIIAGQAIEKIIIAGSDSEQAGYFLSFAADKKITFGLKEPADYLVSQIEETAEGVSFQLGQSLFKLSILGKFNVVNALPAIIIGRLAGLNDEQIGRGLTGLKLIPGRMEIIDEGQDFTVIVDYAHEQQSLTKLLQTARAMRKTESKIIILLGAEGGGRDKTKRPIMGQLAAQSADYVIVSNVDPYDDDPREIAEDIARAALKFGKERGRDLFVIEDRRAGIRKALSLAQRDDLVLITGKGAEQSMIIAGKSLPWDDREKVRDELSRRGSLLAD